jgi:NAD(P)-dependent dehydrogenase (short-subunit alcohol dehydrogenase family)
MQGSTSVSEPEILKRHLLVFLYIQNPILHVGSKVQSRSPQMPLPRGGTLSSPIDAFDLKGRVAIVTGGSRGIGRSVAIGFAALGAHVVVASRKADACEETVDAIQSAGGSALSVPTHIGQLEDIARLVERTASTFGGIDIVVNNAANPLAQPLGAITPEAFAKSYEANVRGPLFLVQEALPYLKASNRASVINVLTAGVFTHGTGVSLYVAAKSAMLSFTRSMAAEFAPHGIRVNAVAPGAVATQMTLSLPPERQESAVKAQLIRRMANPDELVPGMLFLASDASAFMTGQVLVLDGGLTVP